MDSLPPLIHQIWHPQVEYLVMRLLLPPSHCGLFQCSHQLQHYRQMHQIVCCVGWITQNLLNSHKMLCHYGDGVKCFVVLICTRASKSLRWSYCLLSGCAKAEKHQQDASWSMTRDLHMPHGVTSPHNITQQQRNWADTCGLARAPLTCVNILSQHH